MDFHFKDVKTCVEELNTSETGLTEKEAAARLLRFGENRLTPKAPKSFAAKVIDAIKEPMLLILLFGFVITLGANIGKQIKTGDGDFTECFGILAAVVLSVSITLIMEGSSEKAFRALSGIASEISVKVVRSGKTVLVPQKNVVKGDLVLIESGDKIVADGRIISAELLSVDESALTGESRAVKKSAEAVLPANAHLAERVNCAYSGTFVTGGRGAMIVTATGDETEIGRIAGELSSAVVSDSPLNKKLTKLGKTVTLAGAACAAVVFLFSIMRLIFAGNVSFDSVSELFISCIVLIIAAVPEGLPTIVAVSLALNMIRLAREKTLIKKMIATETTGAVSVICSDKTGTLTKNEMAVSCVCGNDFCSESDRIRNAAIIENFVLNSTAEPLSGKRSLSGGTELALIAAAAKNGMSVRDRKNFPVLYREPFSSEKKYMITAVLQGGGARLFIKGAPEKVLLFCDVNEMQRLKILSDMETHQKKAERILCFAHADVAETGKNELREKAHAVKYVYDGYCALKDPVREDVKEAIENCKSAGIEVKMLTGDNLITALAVARELKIADGAEQAILASDLDGLDEEELIKALKRVTVIARSTPIIKLKVVRALKKSGAVVAVTGDGINDAPAIRHADVGIAMGRSGSEITKEAADVVLLDDGFKSVVKAVAFGRNVYRNLQRFILFQLSVNVAALTFITAAAILGLNAPFNTLQLLWINVIMDGPPALTLGLEPPSGNLMRLKPVRRSASIIDRKTFLRILLSGLFVGAIMLFQYLYNFLGAKAEEKGAAVFTLFIFFQLFNAFNCRELGTNSIFTDIGRNKIMVGTFSAVFLAHLFIVQVLYKPFGLNPMSAALWLKCLMVSVSVIAASELAKAVFRRVKKGFGGENSATFTQTVHKNRIKA